MQHYEIPQSMIDDVLAKAEEKKIKPKDEAEKKETIADLRYMLKALIAYNVWDRSEYFQFINKKNDIVKKALEVVGVKK